MKLPIWSIISVLVAFGSPSAADENASFSISTRVTDSTVLRVVSHARSGDIFWGRPESKIPREYRGLSVRSFENLSRRLEGGHLSNYSAVVLDGEYRDYEVVLSDVSKVREAIDAHNKGREGKPLRFIAFFHMRIIDKIPDVVKIPDTVLIGKSYWTHENILESGQNRNRRIAPPYVNMIRKAGKKPAILLGSPEKEAHTASTVLATIELITKKVESGGLGVHQIGFFYPQDKAEILIECLKARQKLENVDF